MCSDGAPEERDIDSVVFWQDVQNDFDAVLKLNWTSILLTGGAVGWNRVLIDTVGVRVSVRNHIDGSKTYIVFRA
ncbi:hypothetical protein V8E36_004994 [Tilletia maclaganii]